MLSEISARGKRDALVYVGGDRDWNRGSRSAAES